jgi:polyferredoxin
MQRLKALFHILFTFDPLARLDLFIAFPFIRRFFTHRRNIAALRTFGDVAFSILIIVGLFGPQDSNSNIILFLAWGVWWAGVVLSWFFVGKFWCGVCPFPGIGGLLQHLNLSLKLNPPHALRRSFSHIAIALFAAIIWAEVVTDLKHRPLGTALLLLAILAGATIMAILYKGQAWCRYVCPLGKIIGAGAAMSMIELRASPNLCRECREIACKKGRPGLRGCPVYLGAHNVKNSLNCLLCGRCVLLCEKQSPRLLLRNPFVELLTRIDRNPSFTFIIPFLAGSQWARFVHESTWYHPLAVSLPISPIISFSLLLALCFAVFIGIVNLGNRLIDLHRDSLPDHCSSMVPILTPLTFSGELAYRLHYLLAEAGQFPTVFSRQFNLTLGHYSFTISPWFLNSLSATVLILGWSGSLYLTVLFARRQQDNLTAHSACWSLQLLISFVFLIYLLLVL